MEAVYFLFIYCIKFFSDVGEVFNTLYGDEEQPSVILIGHR